MKPAPYNAVVVEDENHSRMRLCRLLSNFSDDVRVVGEAADGPTALDLIDRLKPDLVFMDIELPGFNGFRVWHSAKHKPDVIFTTAFDEHALEAFQTSAIDYLLKPIDLQALRRALTKYREFGSNPTHLAATIARFMDQPATTYLTRITCREGDKIIPIGVGEVLYFRSDRKYTAVHTANAGTACPHAYLSEKPLIELERELNPRDFVRIHRSTIVNISWIKHIRRDHDGKLRVQLSVGNAELMASRTYAENLRNL